MGSGKASEETNGYVNVSYECSVFNSCELIPGPRLQLLGFKQCSEERPKYREKEEDSGGDMTRQWPRSRAVLPGWGSVFAVT